MALVKETMLTLGADGLLHSWAAGTFVPPPPSGTTGPQARITTTLKSGPHLVLSATTSSVGPSGSPLSTYSWNLGDGTNSLGSTVDHTYAAAGTYFVTLTVTDAAGASGSTRQSFTLNAAVPGDVPPVPSFTTSASGLTVTVNAAASTDSDGTIASYVWTFGDGGAASGVSATHTYAVAGTYPISLVVTDNQGATGTLTKTLTLSTANLPPTAKIVVTNSGMTSTYNASGSSDPNGDPLTYDVDWGDGSPHSTAVTNSHTYSTVGPWTVTLVVSDNKGGTATATTVAAPGGVIGGAGGDPGTNQTGTNNQQTGAGITLYQSLTPGADLTATIKPTVGSILSFPAGTFAWSDFTHGSRGGSTANGNTGTGLVIPIGSTGVYGAGSAQTSLLMTANSSTKGSTVPTAAGTTNQLYYLDVTNAVDGFTWDGLNMVGTAQGHLYNGFDLTAPGNVTISNSTFSGVPGNSGSPPGETFLCNVYNQPAGKTINFRNCTFDGNQNGTPVAAALLGTNTTRGTINITDCVFKANKYSATVTIWELAAGATINIHRPVIQAGGHRNIGNEAQAGTINIYDPLFPDPPSGEDDIRITWTSNYNSGTINIYFTSQANCDAFFAARTNKKIITICAVNQAYGGSAGGAYLGTNDIRNFCNVYIAGVKQTTANYWTFIGHPVN